MTRALPALLLFIFLALAPARGETVFAVQPENATPGEIFAAALDFMAPRILDAVPLPQLTLWGLRGLTALDPALTPEIDTKQVRLTMNGRVLLARPAPAADDANGWGLMAGEAMRAAAAASVPVQQAGRTGMVSSFFDELFNHLDPYSRYVPPDDAQDDRARRSGTAGIGVQLAHHRGKIFIHTVLSDGPGAEAGLRAGDQILAVDGVRLRGQSPAQLNAMLAGPDGSAVTLLVRGRDGEIDQVEVVRATLPPETVFAERQGDVLVLRLTAFSRDTDDRLANELTRGFLAGGGRIRGVVLDLRGNRGGLLRQAAEAVSKVLDRGVIAVTAGRDSQAAHEFHAAGGDMTGGRPLVVVVDGRSASAAEIMAAALADNGRAVVVGSSTLGKGLVQTITPLPDGGELFVTWSRVLAPLGWPIQGLGVLPQVCTSLGRDSLQHQLDDLSRGVQGMAAALARERAARAPVPPAEIMELRAPCPAAEGQDLDMLAAHYLIERPEAYAAALLPRGAAHIGR